MFGIIPSDELELSSVLGDTRAYLYRLVPFGGSYCIQSRKVTRLETSFPTGY